MGKADVEKAIGMLDPEECARRYVLPNIMAREEYRLAKSRVNSFDEMMEECIGYYTYHFKKVIAAGADHPPDMVRGTVWHLLEQGYKGGIEAAGKAAMKGLNGGLPGVLDSIRDHFLKQQEEAYFNHTVMESVDVMDLDDIKDLMEQYVRKYGRSIDGEHIAKAEYLVPKFRQVLKHHAQYVEHVRMNLGR